MNEQQPGKDMAETNLEDTGTLIEKQKEFHNDTNEDTENQDANNEACESKSMDHEPVNENSAQQESGECNLWAEFTSPYWLSLANCFEPR